MSKVEWSAPGHHIYSLIGSGTPVDEKKCREVCFTGGRLGGFVQCSRKAKVFETVYGMCLGFCSQHSTARQLERRKKRRVNYLAKAKRVQTRLTLAMNCFSVVSKMSERDAKRVGIHKLWRRVQELSE